MFVLNSGNGGLSRSELRADNDRVMTAADIDLYEREGQRGKGKLRGGRVS
jgi:hypothetical protein